MQIKPLEPKWPHILGRWLACCSLFNSFAVAVLYFSWHGLRVCAYVHSGKSSHYKRSCGRMTPIFQTHLNLWIIYVQYLIRVTVIMLLNAQMYCIHLFELLQFDCTLYSINCQINSHFIKNDKLVAHGVSCTVTSVAGCRMGTMCSWRSESPWASGRALHHPVVEIIPTCQLRDYMAKTTLISLVTFPLV